MYSIMRQVSIGLVGCTQSYYFLLDLLLQNSLLLYSTHLTTYVVMLCSVDLLENSLLHTVFNPFDYIGRYTELNTTCKSCVIVRYTLGLR